jgi:hypothetical protein
MTPVEITQDGGPLNEHTMETDQGLAFLYSVFGGGYFEVSAKYGGVPIVLTFPYTATKRQAQVVWTGTNCGGTSIRGATRTCTVAPRDTSLRLTSLAWSFDPDSTSVPNVEDPRGEIAGPLASSSWSGTVVASGNMRVIANVGTFAVDTMSAKLLIAPRTPSSMGVLSFTQHNTTMSDSVVSLANLGLTGQVISFGGSPGASVQDDGPNDGYWWFGSLTSLVWVDTVWINYPAMLVNSAFWMGHQASPPAGVCSRSFVAGSGENQLKRRVEKHEGTNADAGSHVLWQRDTVTSLMSTIQARLERTLSSTDLTHSQWMSRLFGVTYAQFFTIDTTRNDPITTLGCTLVF